MSLSNLPYSISGCWNFWTKRCYPYFRDIPKGSHSLLFVPGQHQAENPTLLSFHGSHSHNTVSDSFSCGWLHQAMVIAPWQNLLKALKLYDKAGIMVVVYPLLRIHSNNSSSWSQNETKLSFVQYFIGIFSYHFNAGEWGAATPVTEHSNERGHLVSSAFSSLFSLGCNPIILNADTLIESTKSPNGVL